ncbi:MAG: histidinol-phosphate transaminase [Xanthobacteraceae bacterium]|nr:histidinol-phosphate transaminase [Xanthobacteraceae bacterium]
MAISLPQRIRLSLNENPFGPSPRALQAVKDNLSNLSRYPGEELAELTNTIAAREDVTPEQIVLGEILNVLGLYLSAYGGGGGEFIYSEPGFTGLVDAVAPGGGLVIPVPLNDQLANDLAAIARRVNRRTRAVYLVNPHNPTGTVSDAEQFRDFVHELSRRTLVIVDEAYLEFTDEFERRTVVDLVRAGARVAVFRTFAKIHAIAGLAIGCLLAPMELATSMRRLGIGAFFDVNRLSLVAANASLRDPDHLASVRARIRAERDAWHKMFGNLNIRYTDSQANFVFFDTGHPHQVLASALAEKGIDIGRGYPPLDNWARISIGLPEENAIARRAVAELLRPS